MTFPVLLDDMPSPVLSAYPKPTVITKKLEAIVRFGRVNSRLKDYFDLWILLVTVDADRADVTLAIAATFARQSCPCSPWPAMLSTNVRVGEACDFTTICDTAKVCEGGAGLHPADAGRHRPFAVDRRRPVVRRPCSSGCFCARRTRLASCVSNGNLRRGTLLKAVQMVELDRPAMSSRHRGCCSSCQRSLHEAGFRLWVSRTLDSDAR